MKRRGRKILHGIASMMLMMGLLFCMSAAVYADEDGVHTHNGITFTAWTDELAKEQYANPEKKASNSLPLFEGNYYLTKNVTLKNTWIPYINNVTNLCLNGKNITIEDDNLTVISIENNSTLNLFACTYGDANSCIIKSTNNVNSGVGVLVNPGCSFTMFNGSIQRFLNGVKVKDKGFFTLKNGMIRMNHTGVNVLSGGTFHMEGGIIGANGFGEGKDASGVNTEVASHFQMTRGKIFCNYICGARINGEFCIKDIPMIYGNAGHGVKCDAYLRNKCVIHIIGYLYDPANIGVRMDNPGIFTTENYRYLVDESLFTSNDSDYEISKVYTQGDTELCLKSRSKTVEDMINALPEPTEDQSAVDAAVIEYLSLDDSQKTLIPDDTLQKLARLVDATTLQELVIDENYMIQANANTKSTKITSAKNKKGKRILVKWKKTTDITGYRILYSTDKNFKHVKEKRVTAKATSATLSNLKKGKTYYIQVQPCTKVTNRITSESNLVYGKSQGFKKVKITK